MIRDYVTDRPRTVLGRTFLLIDSRRGVTPVDAEMLDILDQGGIRYSVRHIIYLMHDVKAS